MKNLFAEYTPIFLEEFEKVWNKTLCELEYNQAQLTIGNRLRPQICLWGYLSLYPSIEVSQKSITNIASISVSIELIHKASLLLDDWIDGDRERHGHPTFHTEYSLQETVLLALKMIGLSMSRLKMVLNGNSRKLPMYYSICLDTLLDTIYSMAQGALTELQLNKNTIYQNELVKEISFLETAKIIANSLLLGYYAGLREKEPDAVIEKLFLQIGETCGYIFQVMNDLEAFTNPQKLYSHKGNVNLDVLNNRKNIAVATLFELVNSRDKKKLQENLQENLLPLITKYKIINLLVEQINDLYQELIITVSNLVNHNVSEEWVESFKLFLNYIKAYGEKRL